MFFIDFGYVNVIRSERIYLYTRDNLEGLLSIANCTIFFLLVVNFGIFTRKRFQTVFDIYVIAFKYVYVYIIRIFTLEMYRPFYHSFSQRVLIRSLAPRFVSIKKSKNSPIVARSICVLLVRDK